MEKNIEQEQKRREEEQKKREEERAELLKKNPDLKFLFGLEQEFILDKKENNDEATTAKVEKE